MQTFDYLFNVGGNYTAVINGMTDADAAVETLMGRERKHEKI